MTIRYSQNGTSDTKAHRRSLRQLVMNMTLSVLWWTAQAPTRRFLENHLFSPRTHKTTDEQKIILQSGRKFQVRVFGKDVQCWQLGNGPGILFAHGWNGRGIQFHHFFDRLAQGGYSAVIFDAPAHGESQGRVTNGFEIAETIRALLEPEDGLEIKGIVSHSLGAASTVMALTKLKRCPDAVLIAPPMRLREILFGSFEKYGIPKPIYETLISELEVKLGYDFKRDDPHLAVETIPSEFLIVHDREDLTVPHEISLEVSEKSDNVTLHTTEGLGHKQILADPAVIDLAVGFFSREG